MRKNEKLGLWSTVIWNLTLFGIIIIVFIKLLLRCINEGLGTPEEYIIFILIGLFITVNIKSTFKNIKKLHLYYKGENINEKKQKEIFMCEYGFMKMYQKLSLRRMFLLIILPLIFISVSTIIIYISLFSNGKFSLSGISNFW
ncbi:MAG: hypothetical protein Q4D53_08550, partial [Leptotrichiaceae bacterium]|nr:hypothetical protein [Leptotrichiaceae bacterium]